MCDDTANLLLALQGDQNALCDLLRLHAAHLRAILANRIPGEWQAVLSANDVLQQTFADAFRDIRRFDPDGPASFRTWLSKLAQCNLADALRMLNAQKKGCSPGGRVPLDPSESACLLWTQLTTGERSPSQLAMGEEDRELLKTAIASLPANYQAAITLYDLQGKPIADVAACLRKSPGAIHMLRARAFDQLKELLRKKLGHSENPRECGPPISGKTTDRNRPEGMIDAVPP